MMSNQIPVLYTEHKTKKVKIWLDGYLVPRPTLNSARLISAGKHEIDVVFYSSIDEIKPGREFETERYLISVEESNDQPCPKPSFAVNDPTMKNKPKSAAFIPPRLVPKPEPPPASMQSLERHNPHQWGYTGMTTAMKRSAYEDEDDDNDNNSNYASKITKSSHFIPPAFQKYESIRSEVVPPQQLFLPPPPPPPPPLPAQQPGLLNDARTSILLNNSRPQPLKSSPVKQTPKISWSTWDDKKSDDEDCNPPSISHDENLPDQPLLTKQTFNWHSLVKSAGQIPQPKNAEIMPTFDFDDTCLDTLFDD